MSAEESSKVPQSLLDWPYATRQLLQTPHPEVIEAHARNLLSRALNVGRLTAFVGSGASMAYGRISWIDMLCAAQEAVLKRYEDYENDLKDGKNNLAGSHIARLATLLKAHKIERDRKYDASAQLTVFQLSEELDKAIDAADRLRGKQPTKTFRDTIMWVTRDERGHTERLLYDAFLDRDVTPIRFKKFLQAGKKENPFTEFNGYKGLAKGVKSAENKLIEQLVQRTLWGKSALLFKGRYLPQFPNKENEQKKFTALLEKKLTETVKIKKDEAENIVRDFEKFISSPVNRYRLAARFRKLSEENRFQVLKAIAEIIDELRDAEEQNREHKHSVRGNRFSEENFRYRDPLSILHRELGIRRFLTTNYDHEIGRLFKDIGYHCAPKEDKENATPGLDAGDPIAPMYKEILFDQESTGELAALATSDRSRRRANWVVHLHGRAEDEGGSIIVTEEDYQRHYARNDEHRASMDDAVKLAFAAQPILFVGIGMDEVDLLRPLREFMSETTRLGDRLVVALLPADGDTKEESARKILLLRRYGVYTIHFGEASLSLSPKETKSGRWLALIKKMKSNAEEIFKLFDKAENDKTVKDFINRRKEIRKESKKFSGDLKTLGSPVNEEDCPFFDTKANQITIRVPDTIETIPAREFELKEEIRIFNEALEFIYQLRDLSRSNKKWFQFRREAQSHRAMLAGAYSAIQTVCLCAVLKRLAGDWKKWRNEWRKLPKPAPVHHDEIPKFPFDKKGSQGELRVLWRHAIDLPSAPDDKKNQRKRFYAGAPSQTFYSLMSALEKVQNELQKYTGRRVFLLIARRGVGKGHFFAALQPSIINGGLNNNPRLIEFLDVIGPHDEKWAGAAFFNLSFSLEVESVFDRLATFLWDCWLLDNPNEPGNRSKKKEFKSAWDSLQNNRIERLRYVLRLYELHRSSYRILLALNGISILFDRDGYPKNGQIQSLFETLIHDSVHQLPIDIIFVCTENAIPKYFRTPPPSQSATVIKSSESFAHIGPLQELLRDDIREKSRLALQDRNKLLDLHVLEEQRQMPEQERSAALSSEELHLAPGLHQSANFVHLLHEARASVVMNSFFPVVALIIAWVQFRENQESQTLKARLPFYKETQNPNGQPGWYANFFDLDTAQATRVKLKDFLGADGKKHERGCVFKRQKDAFPPLMVAFALAFEKGWSPNENDSPTTSVLRPSEIIQKLLEGKHHKCIDNLDKVIGHLLQIVSSIEPNCEDYTALLTDFKNVSDDIDKFTKKLYSAVGRGRFAFTLLMAAAYELFSSRTRFEDTSKKKIEHSRFYEQAIKCHQFLEDVCLDLENQREPRRRGDVVIERILQVYQMRHEDGEVLPILMENQLQPKGTIGEFTVQQWVLWHLAVFSVPVEAEVLAQCPLIEKALRDCTDSHWLCLDKKDEKKVDVTTITAKIEKVIELLEFRCLVYRIKPRIEGELARYGIHRRLQRHIFAQMDAPFVEYPEVDQFSLTLYARQPNDIPRLSPAAHGNLRKTVAVLSGYPEDNEAIEKYEKLENDDKRARVLRAAYGILRSVYSVAGVARFDIEHEQIEDASSGDGSLFGLGFFEEHRQQIRWIGEQAKKLSDKPRPFYAGEIAWLYNECGVLSLVQGRLPDAFALFGLAMQALDNLEPDRERPGPLRALVLLNRAIVDIERGRIRRATNTLKDIIPSFSETADKEARLIAEGYLALTFHLAGNFDQAERRYKSIIKELVKLRRSRSASIFSKHYADLLRRRGNLQRAQAVVTEAIQLAQEGNHEDVRHLAILSEATILIESPIEQFKPEPIHSRLDMVERYARVMGIPRMTAEVHGLRARLHKRSGDLRTAGSFAEKSLEIASLHELQIRKASDLVLYASINLKRGLRRDCRPLLEEALTITRDTEYYAAYAQAQELLHDLEQSGDSE